MTTFIDWDSVALQQLSPGVRIRTPFGKNIMLSLVEIDAGWVVPTHSHPHEQIAYVLSGRIDFHIGDEVITLGAGGLLVIPPNAVHWGVVVGDDPVLNLDVFTPKRTEYAS